MNKISKSDVRIRWLLGILIAMLLSCSCSALRSVPGGYTYQAHPQTGDGWQTTSLQDVGMDSELMVTLMNDMADSSSLCYPNPAW